MSRHEDEDLIDQAMAGDEAALEALFRRHYKTMHRFAQKICPNAADAEDIAHDAFVKLMGSIHTFDRRSAFTSWLYRVVLNKAIDFRRKHERRNRLARDYRLIAPEIQASSQEAALSARQVVDLILGFPERERDAALLVLGEGLTHAEAAAIIGCPVGTIGWLLNKATTRLNTLMDPETDEREQAESPVRNPGDPTAVARG